MKSINNIDTRTAIIIDDGNKHDDLKQIVINRGVRQGCYLSPLLLTIYIDDIITCKRTAPQGIQIHPIRSLETLPLADQQLIITSP